MTSTKTLSRKPTAHAAVYWSLAPYLALAFSLGVLLWRLSFGLRFLAEDSSEPVIFISLVVFVVTIFISRSAKTALSKTVDGVIDEGDSLRVCRDGQQASVALRDIERVYSGGGIQIVLALRADHPFFGRQIIFWQNPYARTAGARPGGRDAKFLFALSERCRRASQGDVSPGITESRA